MPMYSTKGISSGRTKERVRVAIRLVMSARLLHILKFTGWQAFPCETHTLSSAIHSPQWWMMLKWLLLMPKPYVNAHRSLTALKILREDKQTHLWMNVLLQTSTTTVDSKQVETPKSCCCKGLSLPPLHVRRWAFRETHLYEVMCMQGAFTVRHDAH